MGACTPSPAIWASPAFWYLGLDSVLTSNPTGPDEKSQIQA